VLLAVRGLRIFVVDRARATGVYVALLAPLTWFTGAIVVLDVESGNSSSTINSLGKALWWALTTITTVGYGDLYPITTSGKFVAAVLMITGISLFSAGAGLFANWILEDKKNK
jgi:voltage-gated potassium channel